MRRPTSPHHCECAVVALWSRPPPPPPLLMATATGIRAREGGREGGGAVEVLRNTRREGKKQEKANRKLEVSNRLMLRVFCSTGKTKMHHSTEPLPIIHNPLYIEDPGTLPPVIFPMRTKAPLCPQ